MPLFWHFTNDTEQKATTVVLNYFHRSHGNETTDCLFPLIYYRRGARPGRHRRDQLHAVPVVHYRRDADSSLFATLLGASWKKRTPAGDRAFGFVGPYFWYQGAVFDAKGIPFIYADVTNGATHERTRQYGLGSRSTRPGAAAGSCSRSTAAMTTPRSTTGTSSRRSSASA